MDVRRDRCRVAAARLGQPSRAAWPSRASAQPAADRAAAPAQPGNNRTDREGADGHQGCAADLVRFRCPAATWCTCRPAITRGCRGGSKAPRSATRLRSDRQRGASAAGRVHHPHRLRGASREREIQRDIAFLTRLWADRRQEGETQPPASLLYTDLDLALRSIRDLFSSDVERLWCRPPADLRTHRAVRPAIHAAAALARLAVRGPGADLRPFRNRAADRARAWSARCGSSRAATWSSIRPRR